MRTDKQAALAAFAQGAQSDLNAAQAMQNGDVATAAADVEAAASAMRAGLKVLKATFADEAAVGA